MDGYYGRRDAASRAGGASRGLNPAKRARIPHREARVRAMVIGEMDALLFGGGVSLAIPEVAPQAQRSLPPWERM